MCSILVLYLCFLFGRSCSFIYGLYFFKLGFCGGKLFVWIIVMRRVVLCLLYFIEKYNILSFCFLLICFLCWFIFFLFGVVIVFFLLGYDDFWLFFGGILYFCLDEWFSMLFCGGNIGLVVLCCFSGVFLIDELVLCLFVDFLSFFFIV